MLLIVLAELMWSTPNSRSKILSAGQTCTELEGERCDNCQTMIQNENCSERTTVVEMDISDSEIRLERLRNLSFPSWPTWKKYVSWPIAETNVPTLVFQVGQPGKNMSVGRLRKLTYVSFPSCPT